MYIEASAKGRGKNAIIYSPLYRGLKQQCLEFYYHMNGRHIGTLNVYAKVKKSPNQTRRTILTNVFKVKVKVIKTSMSLCHA